MFIFFPIAYPLSKLLDLILGVEEKLPTYSRRELSTMVKIQHEETMRRGGSDVEEGVNKDQITMIDGVLKFNAMIVQDIMTTDVFMLSMEDKLSLQVTSTIYRKHLILIVFRL